MADFWENETKKRLDENQGGDDFWAKQTDKAVKAIPLADRLKNVFEFSPYQRGREILENKALDIYYETGQKATPIYRGSKKGKQKALKTQQGPSVFDPVTQQEEFVDADVDFVGTDPSIGEPIGLRVATPDGFRDIMIGDDPDLAEKFRSAENERKSALAELVGSGEELGFFERIKPGVKLTPEGWFGNMEKRYGPGNVLPIFKDGKIKNAIILRDGKPPALADNKSNWNLGDIADVSGDVGETIASVITQAGAMYAASRSGKPLGLAGEAAVGSAADALAGGLRQGVSAVMAGEDFPGTTKKEEAAQRGIALAASGLGGAVGEVGGRLFKKAWGALPSPSAKKRLAKEIIKDSGNVSALSPSGRTSGDLGVEAEEIERELSDLAGEAFNFTPGQATGTKSVLLKERALAQSPDTMDAFVTAQRKRVQTASQAADNLVKRIASNPDELGNESVGGQLTGALMSTIDGYKKLRTAKARPLYAAAEREAGDSKLYQMAPVEKELADLADQFSLDSKISGPIKKSLASLRADATETGRVSFREIEKQIRHWSRIASGSVAPFENMNRANQRRIASGVLRAIDESLTSMGPALKNQKKAARLFQLAQKTWAKYSEPINSIDGKMTKSLLGLSADSSDEKVVGKIMSSSPKQIRDLAKALSKTQVGKDALQQTRAQVLANIFHKAGGAGGANPLGVELISKEISPLAFVNGIAGNEKVLLELFSADRPAMNKLKYILQGFDRLAQGPGLQGSQTAPAFWAMGSMLKEMKKKGVLDTLGSLATGAVKKTSDFVGGRTGLFMTDDQYLRAVATSDGISALKEIQHSLLNPYLHKAKERYARALVHFASIAAREDLLAKKDSAK